AAPARSARLVELRRRSRHLAGGRHLLDDALARPAGRAVPGHAQPAYPAGQRPAPGDVHAPAARRGGARGPGRAPRAPRPPSPLLRRSALRVRLPRGRHARRARRGCAARRRRRSPVGGAVMRTSALYLGSVTHARNDELARRTFRYPVYFAAIDLTELPALD